MRQITENMSEQLHALASDAALILLAEVEVPTNPPTRYRVTSHNEDVDFGLDGNGDLITYQRFPIAFDSVSQSAEGDIPQMNFQVSNATNEFRELLFTHRGFKGRPVVVRFVSQADLPNVGTEVRFDGKIIGVRIKERDVLFGVSISNLYNRSMPSRIYQSVRCASVFGEDECGYNKDHPLASFTDCPLTVDGCTERGDDEELVMLVPRQHPERMGIELGLRRSR